MIDKVKPGEYFSQPVHASGADKRLEPSYGHLVANISEKDPEPPKHDNLSIPVFQDEINPEDFEGYKGDKLIIKSTVVEVDTEFKGNPEKALIQMSDFWIDSRNPFPERLKQEQEKEQEQQKPNHDHPRMTVIKIGGGDSRANANTSNIAYYRDAQNKLLAEEDPNNPDTALTSTIANFIAVSHPANSDRSVGLQDLNKDDMKTSARIIYEALMKAKADGSLHFEDHIVIMGESAGGALAIELAALMRDSIDQVVLTEPAGVSDQPNLEKEAFLGTFRHAGDQAKEAGLGMLDTAKAMRSEMYNSMTQPHGNPSNIRELAQAFLPPFWEGLNPKEFPVKSGKERIKAMIRKVLTPIIGKNRFQPNIAELYGIENHATGSGLNTAPLKRDSTRDAREQITVPITLVYAERSHVVNPMDNMPAGTTDEEMGKYYFHNSKDVAVIKDPSQAHSGLGRMPAVFEQILKRIQRIPLAEKEVA